MWKKLALIGGVITLVLFVGFYIYVRTEVSKAKSLIISQEPELAKFRTLGTGVFSAPEVILPGDQFPQDYLVRRLIESNFRQDKGSCTRCFNFSPGKIVIKQPDKPQGQEPIYQSGTITLTLSAGVIQSITPAGQLIIPPRFLRQTDNTSRRNATGTENEKLRKAITAAEDKRFFEHGGLDYIALVGALIRSADMGEDVKSHGTTISMQTARGMLLQSMQKGVLKQAKTMIYALALEEAYDKDGIFQLYVNHVYLGPDTYGFAAAARRYFCTSLEEATEEQCAALAGKLRLPGSYGPKTEEGRKNWATRTNQVLAGMGSGAKVESKYFIRPTCAVAPASAFVPFVWEEVAKKGSGGRTETTLNPYIQSVVEEVVGGVKDLPQPSGGKLGTQLLAVVIDPETGYVLGEAQKGDYQGSLLSTPFTGGSTLKPFVYVAVLTKDIDGLNNPVPDDRAEYENGGKKPYVPTNLDKKYLGPISWYRALVLSRNPPPVFIGLVYGFDNLLGDFKDLGFEQCPGPFPTIAEGQFGVTPLQLALAYSVFATGGSRPTKAVGIPGSVGHESHFTKAAILRVNAALRDVLIDGTAAKAGADLGKYRGKVFAKTGSATEGVVVVLFTGKYVIVVWAGSVEYKPLKGTAGKIVAPIAVKINNRILAVLPRLIGTVGYDATAEDIIEETSEPTEVGDGEVKETPSVKKTDGKQKPEPKAMKIDP